MTRGGRDAAVGTRGREADGADAAAASRVGEAGMRAAYSAGQGFWEFGTRTVETRA